MKPRLGSASWLAAGCLLLIVLAMSSGRLAMTEAVAKDQCPPGETPSPDVSLGDVLLTRGAPPYATMALSRITLQPGESLDPAPEEFTAYVVESGELKYRLQPGFEILDLAECVSPGGHYSGGGTHRVDEDGMLHVTRGKALISAEVPTGPIANGGNTPLVMLQMTLVLPQIDPASGLPIVDPGTLAHHRAVTFEQRREACKAAALAAALGTPPDPALYEPIATPAVSTGGWETDSSGSHRDADRLPRSCQKP